MYSLVNGQWCGLLYWCVWWCVLLLIAIVLLFNSYVQLLFILVVQYISVGIYWGVCSVGVQWCGVVVWVCGWCGVVCVLFNSYYILLYMGYSGVVWCGMSSSPSLVCIWYIVVVGVVCVYGVVCMCICYIYYILYYIVVCILYLYCQYLVSCQLVSVCQCVGYCLDTTQRLVVPPQCCVLVRHNIDINKIKNQHKLNTS